MVNIVNISTFLDDVFYEVDLSIHFRMSCNDVIIPRLFVKCHVSFDRRASYLEQGDAAFDLLSHKGSYRLFLAGLEQPEKRGVLPPAGQQSQHLVAVGGSLIQIERKRLAEASLSD